MFQEASATGYHPVLDKIRQKTLVFDAHTLLTEFRLEQGAILPLHSHPHEQTGYLVAGRLELTIGDATHLAEPGDSAYSFWARKKSKASSGDATPGPECISSYPSSLHLLQRRTENRNKGDPDRADTRVCPYAIPARPPLPPYNLPPGPCKWPAVGLNYG
jgi:hypothetical protein